MQENVWKVFSYFDWESIVILFWLRWKEWYNGIVKILHFESDISTDTHNDLIMKMNNVLN